MQAAEDQEQFRFYASSAGTKREIPNKAVAVLHARAPTGRFVLLLVAGVPAWAGIGSTPNSHMYTQLAQYLTCPV